MILQCKAQNILQQKKYMMLYIENEPNQIFRILTNPILKCKAQNNLQQKKYMMGLYIEYEPNHILRILTNPILKR